MSYSLKGEPGNPASLQCSGSVRGPSHSPCLFWLWLSTPFFASFYGFLPIPPSVTSVSPCSYLMASAYCLLSLKIQISSIYWGLLCAKKNFIFILTATFWDRNRVSSLPGHSLSWFPHWVHRDAKSIRRGKHLLMNWEWIHFLLTTPPPCLTSVLVINYH